MKVQVIGQTWEQAVTGGSYAAYTYDIPDSTPLNRWGTVRRAINARHSDFFYIEDICVPDRLNWERPESEDIYLDCMYPEMEAEA